MGYFNMVIFALCIYNISADCDQFSDKPKQSSRSDILTKIAQKLWDADNRLKEYEDYKSNRQQQTTKYSHEDISDKPLFSFVKRNLFEISNHKNGQKSSYKAFTALLDNYERKYGIKENITRHEKCEEGEYLNIIFQSTVMKEAFEFLKKNGKINSMKDFKHKLKRLWFQPYRSSRKLRINDSSGFEHVFVGEIDKNDKVSGFHNWIQFYRQEKDRHINYLGFFDKSSNLISMKFKWDDHIKRISSMFIGTSPEYEMALYTIVYMMGYSDVEFTLSGIGFIKVVCYGTNRDRSIRTCYPAFGKRLSFIMKQLWDLDVNRFCPKQDFNVSMQSQTIRTSSRDISKVPFFDDFKSNLLERPTYKAFISLLDNYEKKNGVKEDNTIYERVDENKFMDLIIETDVAKKVYKILKDNRRLSSLSDFKQILYQLWFQPYWRSSKRRIVDSSGFEHVFVGEIKRTKVSGFHNWIQLYLQEKANNLNYFGYLKKPTSPSYIMMKFKWHNKIKAIDSFFLGTSPEFEISLYTLVYMMGYSDLPFNLNGDELKIKCYGINKNKSIGTCFPSYA